MKLHLIKNLYEKNNLPESDLKIALNLLITMNEQVELDLEAIETKDLDRIVEYLVANRLNTIESFVVLMRYYRVTDRKDLFIHLTKYTGMLDVMDNIVNRLKRIIGEEESNKILEDFELPKLGVAPTVLPDYAAKLMNLLNDNLTEEQVKEALTGNNHNLSKDAVLGEKIEYENSASFKDYLLERHQRKVNELDEHLKANKLWFEQIITQEVVDFVANNQEVLSGDIVDETLYITKIPYDTLSYLNATDEIDKKYYACHCPFAREAIKSGFPKIDGKFCYCSAGFAKFPFEVILDQKLKIKVLQSPLYGDDICRFAIDLKDINFKR